VSLFRSLPPELQTGLVTLLAANKLTGGLVASGLGDIAGFLLRGLTTINAANVTVVGANVTTGLAGAAGAGTGLLGGLAGIIMRAVVPVATLAVAAEIARGPLERGVIDAVPAYEGQLTQVNTLAERALAQKRSLQRGGDFVAMINFLNRIANSSADQSARQVETKRLFDSRLSNLLRVAGQQSSRVQQVGEKVARGTITYQEGNRRLAKIETEIRQQKTMIEVRPYVTISATATGNAITFAGGARRLVIE
jgi:hypothetical protein